MSAHQQSLAKKGARFAALISRLDLNALTLRQRQVAKLRAAGHSLRSIGARLAISAERVRQIEARLRSHAATALLRPHCAPPDRKAAR
jgi:DNA-binding CsgD family transcriptional regulator